VIRGPGPCSPGVVYATGLVTQGYFAVVHERSITQLLLASLRHLPAAESIGMRSLYMLVIRRHLRYVTVSSRAVSLHSIHANHNPHQHLIKRFVIFLIQIETGEH